MSYTISLDAIDFKYLPITSYARENKVKLFDVKSAKRHDYIEFEIFSSQSNDESTNETIPPYHSTICQICDTSVPTCYIIEHNRSSKHKMNKSIMDNVLERAKKYLNEDSTVPDAKKLPYAYFCDICCLPLLISEKEIHEKSQKHCQELKKEKQIKDLLCLYSLSVLITEDNEELSMTTDSESISSNEDIDGLPDEVNNNETETQLIVEPVVKREVPQRAEERKPQIQLKSVLHNDTLFEPKYVVHNEKLFELNVDPKVADETAADSKVETEVEPNLETEIALKVETNEESKQIIPEAMLEEALIKRLTPFKKISESKVKLTLTDGIINVTENNNGFIIPAWICLLCNKLVKDVSAHIKTQRHLKNIEVTGFKRALKVLLIADSFNHCILCNEIVADVKESNKLHQPLRDDPNSIYIILYHTNCNAVSEAKNKFYIFNHLEIEEQILTCKICNLSVVNSVLCAQMHLRQISHLEKYNELLKSNRLIQVNEIFFGCDFCNIGLVRGTELSHIFDGDHKFFVDFYSKTEDEFELKKNEIEHPEKNLLNLKPILTDIPQEDVSEKPNPVLRTDELPCGILSSVELNTLRCTICEENLSNTKLNVEKHISSPKHKIKYIESLKVTKEQTWRDVEDANKIPNIDFGELFIEKAVNENNVLYHHCQICQSRISYSIKCLCEHLKGKRHLKELAIFLKSNNIEIDPVNCIYNCKACETRVEMASLKEHMSQKSRNCIKIKNFNRCYCFSCNVYVPNHEKNIAEHKNGFLHRVNSK